MNPVALGWLLSASQIVFCVTALVVFVQAAKFAPKAKHFAAAALLLNTPLGPGRKNSVQLRLMA